MKLEMQMTERDKKLLIFLAIFVIVVGIGYWGIKPIIQDIIEINEKIEDEKAIELVNEMKIAELPMIERDNEVYEEEILEARKQFYKKMTPDEVDNMMTSMVLSHDLYSYDLSINIPDTVTNEEAYIYSAKYAADQARKEEAKYEYEEDEEEEESSAGKYDEMFAEEDDYSLMYSSEAVGIYKVSVSMRLGGKKEDLQRFIDEYSNINKAFKIESYSYGSNAELIYNETIGEYERVSNDILNIAMSFFMCEE